MDSLSERNKIRSKIIRFSIFVFFIWLLFLWIDSFNEAIILIRNPDSIWGQTWLRFAFREFKIYTFGILGYLFLYREKYHPNFRFQFIVFLTLLDIFCISLGVFREFVFDTPSLTGFYSRMVRVLTTPVYSICFGIYTIYFSYSNKIESPN